MPHPQTLDVRSLALASALGCAACSMPLAQTPAVPEPNAAHAGAPASLIDAVLADAVQRTGLRAPPLRIGAVLAVVWADGSLGCPRPGRVYTQALVPGFRITVQGGDGALDYHASQSGGWVLCPPGQGREPVPGAARG